ncbi:DUF5994 family protein [Geodermatophilus sp. URMC 64]
MTTIRVTRRPPISPDGVDRTATSSSLPLPEPGDEEAARVALIDPPAAGSALDGAWWPRSRNLTRELPPLVEELHRRGIRVTRVAYNPDAWELATRRLQAGGRIIRLGWFRGVDRQLLNLTADVGPGRVDLLVVPPETTAAVAQRAFSAATDRANRDTPTALLDALSAAGPPVSPPPSLSSRSTIEEATVWESEGGHLTR